jgi:subtilisin family serine protease
MRTLMKMIAVATFAGAMVSCPQPPPPAVQISVQSASGALQVATGQGAQFTASSSTPVQFTWSIVANGATVSGSAYGSISPTTGATITYTAPASVPTQPTISLRASNVANAGEYGEINLTIVPQGQAGISGVVTVPDGLLSISAASSLAAQSVTQAKPFRADWSLPHVEGQVLIVTDDGAISSLSNAQSLRGLKVERVADGVSSVRTPNGQRDQDFAARVAQETNTRVQPNYIYRPLGTLSPNDSQYANQFNLTNIDVTGAWAIQTDGAKVAVLDTGADFSHPDLTGRLIKGKDFCPSSNNACADAPTDNPNDFATADGSGGHGTHTTGIIAANTNNAQGIAGIMQGGQVLVVKVLGLNDSSPPSYAAGTSAALAAGIRYAADNGAKVINMSLGIPPSQANAFDPDALVSKAVDYADSKDVLLVASAGNSATQGIYYPASNAKVLAVGMVKPDNTASDYSERGSQLALVTPGQEQDSVATTGKGIISTALGGGYEKRNGTSEAAPQVSAVAGLIRAKNPGLTALQTRGILETTAKDLGSPGRDTTFGFGLLQAGAALRKTANPSTTTPPPAQTTVYVYADRLVGGTYNGNDPKSGRAVVILPGTNGSASYSITVSRDGTPLSSGTYRVVACINKNANATACDSGDVGGIGPSGLNYTGAALSAPSFSIKAIP